MHYFKNPVKRSEFTYGFHPKLLAELVPDNAVTLIRPEEAVKKLLTDLDEIFMGARRSLTDKTECLRQMIGYMPTYRLITKPNGLTGIEFAVYMRNKTNGETRLASALSLGAGGHAESQDVVEYVRDEVLPEDQAVNWTGELSAEGTLLDSSLREYSEEVKLTSDQEPIDMHFVGLVMDSKEEHGYVGNSHVGFIIAVHVADDCDFDMVEDNNDRVGWFTPKQLQEGIDQPVDFEPWSKMIIENISELSYMLLNEETRRLDQQAKEIDVTGSSDKCVAELM